MCIRDRRRGVRAANFSQLESCLADSKRVTENNHVCITPIDGSQYSWVPHV